jgi:hypothetical protein
LAKHALIIAVNQSAHRVKDGDRGGSRVLDESGCTGLGCHGGSTLLELATGGTGHASHHSRSHVDGWIWTNE